MIKDLEEVRKQVSSAYDCEMREARVHLTQALTTLDSILKRDPAGWVERVADVLALMDNPHWGRKEWRAGDYWVGARLRAKAVLRALGLTKEGE
jgi:hypothetical protein